MKRLLIIALFLMACGLCISNSAWPIPPSPPKAAGAGEGDMTKATYDADANSKIDANKVDDLSATYQVALSLLKGTYTNTYLCKYTASGTLLNCNVDPAGFQTADADLTAIAGLTSAANAIPYFTGSGTAGVISSNAGVVTFLGTALGAAESLVGVNSAGTGLEYKTSLGISSLNLTSATSSIPWVVGTASAPTTEGQAYWNSYTDTLTVGNGSTATVIGAGSGDVTDVGNCSSGNCLDGTSDGGTQILLYDAQGATTLAVGDNSGAVTVTLPTVTSTLAILGANTFTASQTITGDILPEAANTRAIGSTSAEWADIYLGDGAIIYGQNDQSNTITSSATGWSFAKPITIADVSNDNYIKITNNSGGRAPTASVYEIYPDAGVWKINTNGTEATLAILGANTFTAKQTMDATTGVQVGATGVLITSDNDGAITFLGSSDGNDEDLTINLDDTANTAVVSSSTGVTKVDFSGLDLVTTGKIKGAIDVISDADGRTIDAADAYGSMHFATGAGTWTLPSAAAGMSLCVYSTGANAVVVDAATGDQIKPTTNATGDSVTNNSTAGSFICLVAADATDWYVVGKAGTWTDTN